MGCQPSRARNVANKDDTAKVPRTISSLHDGAQPQRSNNNIPPPLSTTLQLSEMVVVPVLMPHRRTSPGGECPSGDGSLAATTQIASFVSESLVMQRGGEGSTCDSTSSFKQKEKDFSWHDIFDPSGDDD